MALVEPKQGFGSLDRSLWELYSLGRRMGLSDLGTENPSARLPSGGPSDHARHPSLAFDLGFTPPIGMAHPIARTFFETMAGDPRVHYVILGDTIWSSERGRHAYTSGGHEGHVHVSGLAGAVAAEPAPPPDRRQPGRVTGTLTQAELEQLWVAEGGSPRQAAMAAAVALRESGGNPQARNLGSRERPEDSRGLWQINVRAHPTWAVRDLYNPRVNARAAIAISANGTNWSPWTTAERARADVAAGGRSPEVVRPGGAAGGGGVTGAIGDAAGFVWDSVGGFWRSITGWAQALVAFVGFVTNPLNWLRAIEVLFGFTLLLGGVGILVVTFTRSRSGPAADAARVVTRVVPAGRAAGALRR